MKRAIFKGVPLASVTIMVSVPRPFRLSVSADPSWGKKIFLEVDGKQGDERGLTKEEGLELAQRLTQAGNILDEIRIEDDGRADLLTRIGIIMADAGRAESRLQDLFDDTVHDLAGRQASAINNEGLEEQCEHLLAELGGDEVEKMIAEAEGFLPIPEADMTDPDEIKRLDALDCGLSDEQPEGLTDIRAVSSEDEEQ